MKRINKVLSQNKTITKFLQKVLKFYCVGFRFLNQTLMFTLHMPEDYGSKAIY